MCVDAPGGTADVLIYAFRHRLWLVAAIVAADLVIGLFVGERLVRWEIEQIRRSWSGE
jgi:hypothetical protein